MRPSLDRAPRPRLPTEVCEQIIDMVAELIYIFRRQELQERADNLRACMLVARSWVPRSRLHLFRNIRLHSDLRTKRFLTVLAQFPAFGQYVEFLRIWPANTKDSHGWIFRALSVLPPLLPRLRDLAFCRLPVLHPAHIVILSRFRTVESLWLYWLNEQSLREIVHLISRFPDLRKLHVWSCQWGLPHRQYSGKQHKLTTLDMSSTSLECERSFLEWAMASGSTCALTTLRSVADVSGPEMDRALQMCCSTLRQLRLEFFLNKDIPPLVNHLSLQRLALCGFPQHLVPVLIHLPLFAPSSLVGIWVDLYEGLTLKGIETIPDTQWKVIDLALLNPKFTRLTSVEFTESSKECLEYPHVSFQRILPNSYMRGILWLHHGDTDRRTRIAPVGAPQYPGLPVQWEDLTYSNTQFTP